MIKKMLKTAKKKNNYKYKEGIPSFFSLKLCLNIHNIGYICYSGGGGCHMISNTTNHHEALELRISKMISEGGLGVEAHYSIKDISDEQLNITNEEILVSKMINEGGLGAELYYVID